MYWQGALYRGKFMKGAIHKLRQQSGGGVLAKNL